MPFIGPLKGACPSLCPQKARRHSLLKKKHKWLLFSDLKLRAVYYSLKIRKPTCYFENHKLGRSPLGTRIRGLERVFKK